MSAGSGIHEWLIVVAIIAAGVIIPAIIIFLFALWLSGKKKRDNMMIERLVEIKQALDLMHARLKRDSDRGDEQ